MSQYTTDELVQAVHAAKDAPFPLVPTIEMARVFADASRPALEGLRLDLEGYEDVKLALETMFVMGIAAGLELGRAR